jgi:hypothetical protein
MDRFPINIETDSEVYRFEVVDYIHHSGNRCKFEVYQDGRVVASFEPDPQDHLYVCQNPGKIDNEILHLLADEIESYDWHFKE